MEKALPIPGLHLALTEGALHLSSDSPLAVTSSAIVGGDLDATRHVINMHVQKGYDCRTPGEDLIAFARDLGITEAFVGLMTAARLDRAQIILENTADVTVAAIVTVGLSHPIAAGISEFRSAPPTLGTINIILAVDGCLARAARVNAIITATEAKALALVESNVRTPRGGWASGTGTDAIVVAATQRGETFEFAGPISPVGALIGHAVRRAILNTAR